jgi:hypothetical protein
MNILHQVLAMLRLSSVNLWSTDMESMMQKQSVLLYRSRMSKFESLSLTYLCVKSCEGLWSRSWSWDYVVSLAYLAFRCGGKGSQQQTCSQLFCKQVHYVSWEGLSFTFPDSIAQSILSYSVLTSTINRHAPKVMTGNSVNSVNKIWSLRKYT